MLVTIDASAVPPNAGGVGRYVSGLLGGLARRSDVDVVVIAGRGDRERWLSASGGRFGVSDVVPGSVARRLAWEQASMPGALRRIAPDVHHGTHYTYPRRAAVPKVVTVHDLTLVEHPEWHSRAKVAFFGEAIRSAVRGADVLVCVSRTTADRLVSRFSPRGRVVVAPHGVDLERFRVDEDREMPDAVRLARLGVAAPYVLFVGTIEPRKDVATLVRAFDKVAGSPSSGRHADLSLVLAGAPGWGDDSVSAAVAASAVRAGRIRRLGFVDDADVPALLRSAAAVAYPSIEEGFGLPALEALACGAPTVTTRGSAMEEFAAGAALLFDPGDVSALADALDQLLRGDPSLPGRRETGLAVAASHTWDASAERHVEAYRSAAG